MNGSILGEDLEFERQKVFYRRFGAVSLRKEELDRSGDRDFVTSLEKNIRSGRGTFSASTKQFIWLGDVERRLMGDPDMSRLKEKLVPKGHNIVRNDALPSGRMLILVDLLEKTEHGDLTNRDLGMLQFLVLEGTSDLDSEG